VPEFLQWILQPELGGALFEKETHHLVPVRLEVLALVCAPSTVVSPGGSFE
jgi:hypothetical protein